MGPLITKAVFGELLLALSFPPELKGGSKGQVLLPFFLLQAIPIQQVWGEREAQ
jgi:hypothetical protein